MSRSLTKEEYRLNFGMQLQKLRSQKGLSLRALAQRCDVDHSDIEKIEKGNIDIRILTVMELANGLDIDIKELLNFTSESDE